MGSVMIAKHSKAIKGDDDMNYDAYSKEMLKKLRKAKGLTQKEMALDSGIPENTLKKLEAGISLPSFETLALLNEYFDVYLYPEHPKKAKLLQAETQSNQTTKPPGTNPEA